MAAILVLIILVLVAQISITRLPHYLPSVGWHG